MTKTTRTASGAAALLALSGLALLAPPAGERPAAAQEAKRAKWEYRELVAHSAGAGLAAVWVSAKGKVTAAGWKGMLKELAGREGAGEAVEVLNALGEQGWELVAVSERPILGPTRPQGETVTRWTFKRPK